MKSNPVRHILITPIDHLAGEAVDASTLCTLAAFVADNGEAPDLIADARDLRRGESCRIGGGAAPLLELTRLDLYAPDLRDAFVADLEMTIGDVEEIRARLLAECQEHGAKYTPRQEGKFEGGFTMVRALLVDHLSGMLQAWLEGGHFSRKGEKIQHGGDPGQVVDRAVLGETLRNLETT